GGGPLYPGNAAHRGFPPPGCAEDRVAVGPAVSGDATAPTCASSKVPVSVPPRTLCNYRVTQRDVTQAGAGPTRGSSRPMGEGMTAVHQSSTEDRGDLTRRPRRRPLVPRPLRMAVYVLLIAFLHLSLTVWEVVRTPLRPAELL